MVEQKCIFGSGLCLKVHINLRLQQARLTVRYNFALATCRYMYVQSTKRLGSSNILTL